MMKHWPVRQPVLGAHGYQEDPTEGQEKLACDTHHYPQMHCVLHNDLLILLSDHCLLGFHVRP